ncbi:MAG TPA: NAD(P)/FAD-dependent oxidoreductase [Limnochordia bacterium]|nr:NAD(P)/FAD-dependent oxidoreductase [Limnochordia bacterium]
MKREEKRRQAVQVAIIGGGIVGTLTARELSRYELDVLLLEKEAEVGWGTTKANSGIVHAGIHEEPGTLKAKYCFPGNQMFPQLCAELDVSFRQNGILVVALSEEELEMVHLYYQRGLERGVPVRLLSREEVLAQEPNLNPEVVGAVFAPNGGGVMPFELAAAAMENAVANGAKLLAESPVIKAWVEGEKKYLETPTHIIEADVVINAAGLFADEVARMFGDDYFTIQPRKGEEYLFDLSMRNLVNSTIFPVPTSKASKGVLVISTADGNVMIGPTSDPVPEKDDLGTSYEGFERIFSETRRLVPKLDPRKIITQFAGLRASSDRGDFIIEFSPKVPGLLHLAGIESPGLTAAPAIAAEVPKMLEEQGLKLIPKENFNPRREGIVRFRELSRAEQDELIRQNPAFGRIVCRCETVTEGEIVDAIRRGARTLDGVKFRTRAGAGRCQSGFCQPVIMELLSRELGIPVEQVTKRGAGSEQVRYAAKELLARGCRK